MLSRCPASSSASYFCLTDTVGLVLNHRLMTEPLSWLSCSFLFLDVLSPIMMMNAASLKVQECRPNFKLPGILVMP